MISVELVSHFVGDIVDVERIADRRPAAGDAARFLTRHADHPETGNATAAC